VSAATALRPSFRRFENVNMQTIIEA
jgi:hypothetical protein